MRHVQLTSCLLCAVFCLAGLGEKKGEEKETEKPLGIAKRVPWTGSRIVGTPDPPPPYTVEEAFPNLTFKGPVFVAEEPGTDRFLVGELTGKIYAFTKDTPNNEGRQLFLDIGRQLYSFSFHPNYEQNGIVFTFSPTDPKDKRKAEDKRSRVSRFIAGKKRPRKCAKESEKVIVEWPAGGHNGGEAIIGPDGYLYVSTGDSTSGSDIKATGQGVNDLLSVIMRLDVDNPAPGKAYSIPKDNPFVNFPGARPEVWAFGFRNPWRMSFDAKTKELWVGDVGQDLWEMIWIAKKGGNYGWSVQEGTHPFHPNKPKGPGPILPPVVEHHHSVCRSITGGYVYYGKKFPELNGVYFYGDYEYGMVWGVRAKEGKAVWNRVLADTTLRIASFGSTRDGEILLIDHPSGKLYQLKKAAAKSANRNFPRRLSETGLFASTARHQVAPGLVPYSVNTPQWLDHATKERFVAVPGDKQLTFNGGVWGFPDGAVNAETIYLEMERGNPKSRRRIETRITVKQENHWLGYSYRWNEAQTDAVLVAAEGEDFRLNIKDSSAPGGRREQTWHIPSRNECMVCHSRAAGFVLGLNTKQLNRSHDYGNVTDNQLRTLSGIGMFSKAIPKQPADYDAFPDPYDDKLDAAARARAYLHVNCSVCHVSDGGGNAKIELRFSQKFKDTKLGDTPMHGSFGLSNAKLVTPGDPYASVLLYRLSKWGRGRMPHVGSNEHDERALSFIEEWIRKMPAEVSPASPEAATLKSVTAALDRAEKRGNDQHRKTIRALLNDNRSAFILARSIARKPVSSLTRRAIVEIGARHPDANVRDLFERFLPPSQRTQRLGNAINMADVLKLKGNVAAGREFFFTATSSQCKNCHQIDRKGGELGPSLNEIGSKLKRHELLESLIAPSKKIDPKFQTLAVATNEGNIYSGILTSKTNDTLTLNIFQSGKVKSISIPLDEIEQQRVQQKSLMPDGLLRDLTAQQAADLLAFLESLKKK